MVIEYSKKESVFAVPGFIRAFLAGKVTSQSLPESAWNRLLSGERLATDTQDISTLVAPHHHRPTYTRTDNANDVSMQKKVYRLLAESQSVSSGINPNTADSRTNGQRRRHLKNQLKQILHDYSTSTSSTFLYSVEWVLYMLQHGTPTTQTIDLRSIYNYYHANSKPLIEQGGSLDLLSLDEDELIVLYSNILNYFQDSTRASRAYSLSLFHSFLSTTYLIEEIDFNEIEPRDTSNSIDANIITLQEYKCAFMLLQQDKDENKATSIRNTLLLCFLYKNGLRPSEAIRLLLSDILIEKVSQVYVRNNSFGQVKTHNAIRQIPFLNRFDKEEIDLILEWLQFRANDTYNRAKSPFFTEGRKSQIAIRYNATKRITLALRLATGDHSIRLRHLRHSFATNLIATACSSSSIYAIQQLVENNNDQHQILTRLFGSQHPTRRLIYQVAAMLGHGSPSTALHSYTHCLDMIAGEYLQSDSITVTGKQLGWLCGYSEKSLPNLLMRNKCSSAQAELNPFAFNLLRHKLPETLQFKIKTSRIKQISLPCFSKNDQLPDDQIQLDQLAEILRFSAIGTPLELIASYFFLPAETIKKWVLKAKEVEILSGYNRFQLTNGEQQKPGWSLLETEEKNINREAKNITLLRNYKNRDLIKKMQSKIQDDFFISALDIWKRSYKAGANGIYCSDEEEASQFIQALIRLGMETEKTGIIIPFNLHTAYMGNTGELQNWVKRQNLSIDNIHLAGYSVFNRTNNNPCPGIAIFIDRKPKFKEIKKPFITTEFLNYYCFLASVLN